MDIKLITYSRTRNYGGILQAYGLFRYLQLQGHNVSFIDYIPRRCNIGNRKEFVDEIASKSKIWGKNSVTKWLFSVIRYPAMKDNFKPFLSFMDTRAKFTRAYYSEVELEKEIPAADVYITGSDQVWNSQFSTGDKLDLPFYLPFVKSGKRISYASSFGKDSIPEEHKKDVKRFIDQYSAVSVREQSGQKILADLDIPSTVVVDPTILCPIDEWENIASSQLCSDYILMYQVTFNKDIYEIAKAIADVLNKKLICISLDSKDKRFVKEGLVVAPPIEDWLSYLKYADGVITDSFHASVFSILFKRQFIVNSGTRKGMSSRISNLLNSLCLSERNVNSFDANEVVRVMTKQIEWDVCHKQMMEFRRESEEWLHKAIEE